MADAGVGGRGGSIDQLHVVEPRQEIIQQTLDLGRTGRLQTVADLGEHWHRELRVQLG